LKKKHHRAVRAPVADNHAADNFITLKRKLTMKNIKVLGTGCANCATTYSMINDTAEEKGIKIELEKIEDMAEIMGFGILSTPGVVLNGQVVHSGGLPTKEAITDWLMQP